ncbi:hypothetical protein [Lichenifustis flavocetrariae]|uniref:Uncharacterized protein n=1 Tax=Lichenifustis flavocetrariae TaxID=2949735 RepID=A0AA41YSR5_9HYPH|nr:hypothetical protein [Lichenifustis flavocetrariae]MCW6507904.1 hypothetical protein [Lichenifustis flavocetrariae]
MDFKSAHNSAPLVPGRECGACTMCCKVYRIEALGKPDGVWCTHCVVGSSCKIYPDRPDDCRDFFCLWRTDATLPDSWKPNVSKLTISLFPKNGFLYVQVDPSTPQAWRKEPYFSTLKTWSASLLQRGRHILVFVRDQATLIMPSGPIPIGIMSPDDGFVVRERFTPTGKTFEVERVASTGGQRTAV